MGGRRVNREYVVDGGRLFECRGGVMRLIKMPVVNERVL